MRPFLPLVAAVALGACGGPPAPDVALCRDAIDRLCAQPRCPRVDALAVGADCVATLLSRSGCGDDAFTFTAISRARFLECRAPLVRASAAAGARAACPDVDEAFDRCPEMGELFGRGPR